MIEHFAKAQAIYMQALVKKAEDEFQNHSAQYAIDPQGRVLVQVVIDQRDILQTINQTLGQKFVSLKQALGRPVTEKTTVSLEINREEFKHRLIDTALSKIRLNPEQADAIAERFLKESKGSLIALTQEYYFHLGLTCRIYQEIAPKVPADSFEAARQQTMLQLDKLIMNRLAKALKAEYRANKPFNMAQINKELDKARAELMPKAHTFLLLNIARYSGFPIETFKTDTNLKEIAITKTATPNDILHVEKGRLATLIAGSEETAHHRKWGKQFAHRQMITHYMNDTVKPNKNPRIQIRTPSLAMKVDNIRLSQDVVNKLEGISQDYSLCKILDTKKNPRKAFTYNLLTAFEDTLDDFSPKNQQTKSTKHILRGTHLYNKAQTKSPAPVYCYLQNISVNGFGKSLGYDWIKGYRREITVMAEMALLHTIYSSCDYIVQSKINHLIGKYETFLRDSRPSDRFSDDPNIVRILKGIKSDIKKAPFRAMPYNSVLENAQLGLRNLLAHNKHFDHTFSKTIQALSVFCEPASIVGCKSGTERNLAIKGRVAILDKIQEGQNLTSLEDAIRIQLEALASGNNTVLIAKGLKVALDRAYNESALQSAASLISLVDQGGPAKVEARPNHGWFFSRNYAEEKASIMSNLQQSKASKMQAHKKMTEAMKQALKGHPKNAWKRMKETVGTLGAALGLITVVPILLVAFMGARDNIRRKEEFFQSFKGNSRQWAISQGRMAKDDETTKKLLTRLGSDPNSVQCKSQAQRSEQRSYQPMPQSEHIIIYSGNNEHIEIDDDEEVGFSHKKTI